MFDHTSAEPSAAVRVGVNYMLPSSRQLFVGILGPGNPHRQRCRYAVSCVAYGVGMFCCVTTAPQHQMFSARFCIPFAGRVAGYATSRLRHRNTRRTSCVPAPSTSASAQRRRQTPERIVIDLLGISMSPMLRDLHWLRSPKRIDFKLAVLIYRCHRLHPARRRFQLPPSSVVVILTASYMAVHCWRSCISGGWKPPLDHLSSNADCFSEPPQNLSLFPIISKFPTVFGLLL